MDKVGSAYNQAASKDLVKALYSIELHGHFDLRRDVTTNKLSPARKKEIEAALLLIPIVREHLKGHVPHLGLFGFSYSELFFYLSTAMVSTVGRYAMHLL